MGAFAVGFVRWVRGMKKIRNAQNAVERAAGEQEVQAGFNEMIAAPIADRDDHIAHDILQAFDR